MFLYEFEVEYDPVNPSYYHMQHLLATSAKREAVFQASLKLLK